jgi:hypothetical protein
MHVVYGILFSYCIGLDCRFSFYLFLLHFCTHHLPVLRNTNNNFLTGIYEILTVSLPNVVSTKIFLTVWPPFLNFGNTTLNLALPSHVVA